jgi:hypothetical protein
MFSRICYTQIVSPATCAYQGVFNKDPTILVDGAIPTNTCILPSFLGNMPVQ